MGLQRTAGRWSILTESIGNFDYARLNARRLKGFQQLGLRLNKKAARAYYRQPDSITITEVDFQDWRRELPPREQQRVAAGGFTAACTLRAFQRFCLEWRGFRMRDFMGQHLSVAAFALWVENHEFNGDLPDSSE